MSLDVYIQPQPEMPRIGGDYEYIGSLDDDGYYWFLYPLFEKLAEQTGQMIDLYDNAVFTSDTLDTLARTLADAYGLAHARPAAWEVVTGVRMGSVPEEVRCKVDKQELYALLDKLKAAVSKATAGGTYVIFVGD